MRRQCTIPSTISVYLIDAPQDYCRSLALAALLAVFWLVPRIAGASVAVMGPLAYDYTVNPGQAVESVIEVQNPGDSPQEVRFYQTDYHTFADGRVLYGEPGQLPRSNARWISFTPKQTIIPPGERIKLVYRLQVPDDSTLTGTYWSMLMVEPVAPGSPESSRPDGSKFSMGIREVVRYAIQIAAHIGATGARQLKFAQIRLQQESGKVVLAVDVENAGERMLPGEFWAELYDPNGKYVGKFDGGKRRLYPGSSARYTVDLIGLQNVTYRSLIVVDCGGDDVFGASANLVLGH
jgi:hypothetical protein